MKQRLRRDGLDAALAVAAVLAITAPLWFTTSGFGVDFINHLWLSWVAGESILQTGHPSYFLSDPQFVGVFYPFFAFYGGPLYTITGAISDALGGNPVLAFSLVTTVAVAGSYLGMLWLSRQLGLRGLLAHAPGLAVITSAYYITNLYGRGAWTEFVATAVIAPLAASAIHLLRTRTWRPLPVLAFVGSVMLFTGSHNITLVWGTTMIVVVLLVMGVALGIPRGLPIRRLVDLAGLGVTSTLMNAWFLFPNLAYAKDTTIATVPTENAIASTSIFDTPAILFDPFRHVPIQSSTPALFVQIPDWFLAWAIIAGGLLLWRRSTPGPLRRAWLAMVLVIAALLGMLLSEPFWNIVPFPLDEIQFAYRLGSYTFYTVAGLVLISALALQRATASDGKRVIAVGLRVALLAVSAVSLALCLWQQWIPDNGAAYSNRQDALTTVHAMPATWYERTYYRDTSARIVKVPAGRQLLIDPEQVQSDHFSALLDVPSGSEPIETNITGGAYLAHISGLERLGRTADGFTVVRRPNGGSGPVRVTIDTTRSPVIVLGWIVSILAILAILAFLVYTAIRSSRLHRSAQGSSLSTTPAIPGDAPLG